MYDHIKKVEEYCLKLKPDIEFVRIDTSKFWIDKLKERGYPSAIMRWCTAEKIRVMRPYLRNSYVCIGVAFDESERMVLSDAKDRINIFPLVDWKMTEKVCLNFCYSRGFNWGGLYEKHDRLSCYCCPFMKNKSLLALSEEYIDKIRCFESLASQSGYNRNCFYYESIDEKLKRLSDKNGANSINQC